MTVNIEVTARGNESNANLIRRFTRKLSSSGIARRARDLKTRTRNHSKNVQKKQALKKLKRIEEIDRLIKLGKLPDRRASVTSVSAEEDEATEE